MFSSRPFFLPALIAICTLAFGGMLLWWRLEDGKKIETGSGADTVQNTFPGIEEFSPRSSSSSQGGSIPTPPPIVPMGTLPLSEERFEHLKTIWQVIDKSQAIVDGSRNNSNYSLSYRKEIGDFWSTIVSEPAARYRHEMESVLREALEMSDKEICELDVKVVRSTDLTLGNVQRIGLSFCPGSVSDAGLEEFFQGY